MQDGGTDAESREAYVLVNNRCEGNAPLTLQALIDKLRMEEQLRPLNKLWPKAQLRWSGSSCTTIRKLQDMPP